MSRLVDYEQRRSYSEEIRKAVPEEAISIDTMIGFITAIDPIKRSDIQSHVTQKNAQGVAFALRAVFQESPNPEDFLGEKHLLIKGDELPITFFTKKAVESIVLAREVDEFYRMFDVNGNSLKNGKIEPDIFSLLSCFLSQFCQFSE